MEEVEVQAPVEEESTNESEVTATEEIVSEEQPEEVNESEENQTEEERKFTQSDLDALIGKRLAREQRKWERQQQQLADEKAAKAAAEREIPPQSEFDDPEAYAEALAERKAYELIQQREQARQHSEMIDAYHEREEDAMDKYDDFKQVAYNQNLPITDVMADTIRTSEIGPDIAYYLGSNMKEAGRISKMMPYAQAKEIGRIEAKLIASPPVKKTTNAPPPISPVASKGGNGQSYDTTDPRAVKSMTDSEWIEAERLRQRKKWEAQHS